MLGGRNNAVSNSKKGCNSRKNLDVTGYAVEVLRRVDRGQNDERDLRGQMYRDTL